MPASYRASLWCPADHPYSDSFISSRRSEVNVTNVKPATYSFIFVSHSIHKRQCSSLCFSTVSHCHQSNHHFLHWWLFSFAVDTSGCPSINLTKGMWSNVFPDQPWQVACANVFGIHLVGHSHLYSVLISCRQISQDSLQFQVYSILGPSCPKALNPLCSRSSISRLTPTS